MKRIFPLRSKKLSIQYGICIALVLIVSAGCYYTQNVIGYRVVALVLLMTVTLAAMLFDILPVLTAAILSAVIWNFFFIPPLYTFHIDHAEDVLMFLLYFLIALVNAVLTFKIREAEKKARDKEEKESTIKLYNTLLNSLSHELRTPISTILGAVDTLKESKDRLSETQQTELLSEIDTSITRLNRQVENLLNMSRLESGMLKLKLDWCDLNELIHTVIQKVNSPAHIIQFKPDESAPLYKLDAGLMEQVLANLIHNAIQYTPAGTKIILTVRYQQGECVLTVSDNGKGFAPTELPYAFDKFYRVPKTKTGGIGLGLSIVKGFVEAHSGAVVVESVQDKGTTFTIRIPVEVSYINHLKNE